MTTGQIYFLAAAQQMSFGKAARSLFVTQQCLSDHIRRLEESCGVRLFLRKPRLALTPEGEAMVRRLHQIRAIEAALQTELAELRDGARGRLRLGIHVTRARAVLPPLLPKWQEEFPKITLEVFHEDTSNFEKMLLEGKLDLFLGVNVTASPEFCTVRLLDEQTFLVASYALLKRYFPDDADRLCARLSRGADLSELSHLPFVIGHPISRLHRALLEFLGEQAITLNIAAVVGDYETQILLCAQDYGLCFCPQMLLGQVAAIRTDRTNDPLLVFPIKGFSQKNRIDLVYHADAGLPPAGQALVRLLQQQFLRDPASP